MELAHPDQEAELYLAVDASECHVGAVLQQKNIGADRPLAFYSVKLDNAQQKYSAFDRELLAAYLAVRHFRWILEGRSFYILSDHKPLSYALHRISDAWSARVQRHLSYLAEYTSDIRHIAGKSNVVSDALSRPAAAVATTSSPSATPSSSPSTTPSSSPSVPGSSKGHLRPAQDRPLAAASATAAVVEPTAARVDFEAIARDQITCQQTCQLKDNGSLLIKLVQLEGSELWCDTSTGSLRPLVPVQQRRQVFEALHGLAHPGIRASRRIITSRFVWPGCAADVAEWCRQCQGCSTGKVTIQEKTAVEPIPLPNSAFQHVHVDLVGPLPTSEEGFTHLLTAVDRNTRWPEVIPLRATTATAVADTFASEWVARYGVPLQVTTDQGTQFTSATWKSLCKSLGMKHVTTSAYHPQSNGLVERFHRQLKEALRARNCGTSWAAHLPWVLLGLRAAPKEDSGLSSAEAVYNKKLVLPGELQDVAEETTVSEKEADCLIQLRQRNYQDSGRPGLLDKVKFVYIRRGAVGGAFNPSYAGPYQILKRSKKLYQLQIGSRREWVSADRLKPHRGDNPHVAQPPRRGRPPGTGGGV